MYTNSTLYYLSQIGIRPWITKGVALNTQENKLVVFLPQDQSKKAQILFKRLLDFIGLPADEIQIIHTKEAPKLPDHLSPFAALVLGFQALDFNLNCPTFASVDPEFLLTNPSHKKHVFKALLCVKECLNPIR